MFHFSQRSKGNLDTCHPDLQIIAEVAIQIIDFAVIQGHRGEEEQNAAYWAGKSKLKFPASKHNTDPSLAFDVIPYINGKFAGWNNREAFVQLAGVLKGVALGLYYTKRIEHVLRWGGDWDRDNDLKDQDFIDLPHLELIKP